MTQWLEEGLINAEGFIPTQACTCEFDSKALKRKVGFGKL